MIIVTCHGFRKVPFSKCFLQNEKPAFSNFFGLKSVFEKLRFRCGSVWTVGLTVEIKVSCIFRFQGFGAFSKLKKAPFSLGISVDGRPNYRNKADVVPGPYLLRRVREICSVKQTVNSAPGKVSFDRKLIDCFNSCKKLYIGETGRRLGDRFRDHLRDVEKDDQNASKPVARHFNLPNHSNQHMVVCGLSLHQGSTESRKTLEQKFIFQIGILNPNRINERFSFN